MIKPFLPKPPTQFRKKINGAAILMCLTIAACSQSVTETAKAQTDEAGQTAQKLQTEQKPQTVATDSSETLAQPDDHDHSAHSGAGNSDASQPPMVMAPQNIDYVYKAAPDDHIIGKASAPLEMIVYASVTCSHCAQWFNNEWPIFKAEQIDTGRTKLVFREFPTRPAELAVPGFIVANCAGENGFFDHILYQFKNQASYFERMQNGDGQAAFMEMAAKAGLNSEADLNACFADKSHLARIKRSVERADGAGLTGVPGFIIGGELYSDPDTSTGALGKVIAAANAK